MRPVYHGDIVCAALSIRGLQPKDRKDGLRRMFRRAELADLYRRKVGRAHPDYGDGSLMGLTRPSSLPPEPPLSDTDYCQCLAMVFDAVVEWRQRSAA